MDFQPHLQETFDWAGVDWVVTDISDRTEYVDVTTGFSGLRTSIPGSREVVITATITDGASLYAPLKEKEDEYKLGYYDGELEKDMEWRLAAQEIIEKNESKTWMDDHSSAIEQLLEIMEAE